MSAPTALLPFQPSTMSTAQLAAVSFLARYSGRTHRLYAFQLREWFSWCEGTGWTRWVGVQSAHVELYIRSRGDRYPAGEGIEPDWTQEVMADDDLLALEPDAKSRMGASRFIGHSPSAGRVIVVIAYRDLDGDLHGVNAWPAIGATLYQEGDDHGQDG